MSIKTTMREGKAAFSHHPKLVYYSFLFSPHSSRFATSSSWCECRWLNDARHGKGVERIGNVIFEGTWRSGLRSGDFIVSWGTTLSASGAGAGKSLGTSSGSSPLHSPFSASSGAVGDPWEGSTCTSLNFKSLDISGGGK